MVRAGPLYSFGPSYLLLSLYLHTALQLVVSMSVSPTSWPPWFCSLFLLKSPALSTVPGTELLFSKNFWNWPELNSAEHACQNPEDFTGCGGMGDMYRKRALQVSELATYRVPGPQSWNSQWVVVAFWHLCCAGAGLATEEGHLVSMGQGGDDSSTATAFLTGNSAGPGIRTPWEWQQVRSNNHLLSSCLLWSSSRQTSVK